MHTANANLQIIWLYHMFSKRDNIIHNVLSKVNMIASIQISFKVKTEQTTLWRNQHVKLMFGICQHDDV